MPEKELPITGYLDRFSHRPGETFTAHVSLRDGGSYRARLVRVLSGDPNPEGPGVRFEDLSHRFDQSFDGRRQAIHLGSYGIVREAPVRDAQAACTWTVLVRPGVLVRGGRFAGPGVYGARTGPGVLAEVIVGFGYRRGEYRYGQAGRVRWRA